MKEPNRGGPRPNPYFGPLLKPFPLFVIVTSCERPAERLSTFSTLLSKRRPNEWEGIVRRCDSTCLFTLGADEYWPGPGRATPLFPSTRRCISSQSLKRSCPCWKVKRGPSPNLRPCRVGEPASPSWCAPGPGTTVLLVALCSLTPIENFGKVRRLLTAWLDSDDIDGYWPGPGMSALSFSSKSIADFFSFPNLHVSVLLIVLTLGATRGEPVS
mmetsp:Transcript_6627/g.16553  ORF Transcript_6627/g.16553 Transcript_6627/m.16553 type:complete len:214 (-) Transcript_6627:2486-3127(-)